MAKKQIESVSRMQIPVNLFLYGDSQIGKTTTLKKLYVMLSGEKYPKSKARSRFVIRNYYGKTIVLCTSGDDSNIIKKNLDFLKKTCNQQKVDIFISAVNNIRVGMKDDPLAEVEKYVHTVLEDDEYVSEYTLYVKKLDNAKYDDKAKEMDKYSLSETPTSDMDADRLKSIIDNFLSMLIMFNNKSFLL